MNFQWGIKQFKANFFNADLIKKKVASGTDRVLSRFGAFVQRRMRSAIRKRKKPSKPGQSPTNQTGVLKQYIFFAKDDRTGSVVVGPARTNQRNTFGSRGKTIPQVLETGGVVGMIEHQLPSSPLLDKWGMSGQWIRTDLRYRIREGLRSAVGRPTRLRWITIKPRPYVKISGDKELASGKHRDLLRNMAA